jgi:hypothetical protein
MNPITIFDRETLTIGMIGSDAGYWTYDPATGKLIWHPGWEVERFVDLVSAIDALHIASRFKEKGLGEEVARPLAAFVQEQLSALPMGARG